MSKDFIHNNILQGVADAIRYCDDTTGGIAPVDYAERIRALDKLIPQPDALNFYMPNGGTISLNKTGSPTVVELEYSLDRGTTWMVWQEDEGGNRSLTLTAGQRMYVRNTSMVSTGFSTSASDYYRFTFTDVVAAHGNTNSLLCKNPENSVITDFCYRRLFDNASTLVSTSQLPSTQVKKYSYSYTFYNCVNLINVMEQLPATVYGVGSCFRMFANCANITTSPNILSTNSGVACFQEMFNGCSNLSRVYIKLQTILDDSVLLRWLQYVAATGDFYCPAELTIPTGVNGIPSGWTRHDI